ncbi:MAG: DUF692 family protein [Nitrospira sp.]|nr:DUF692 family protein [Nitrospira sp.]
MTLSRDVCHDFQGRVDRIPVQGLGLSVDVYSPDLFSLLADLTRRQVLPMYLEVFHATSSALAAVRDQTDLPLPYHGEGLWVTQPGAESDPLFQEEAQVLASHLSLLRSAWSNHECATKHIAGYSFGTYLPPLYTAASADIVAQNINMVQAVFDQYAALPGGGSPLFLLEMPPLTFFVAGTLSIPAYFRRVTEQAACGLVLDVGHLWTVYRYSGAWRAQSLAQFVDGFLREFPVERVVEIHVAGLAVHESLVGEAGVVNGEGPDLLPRWTDAHAAPIPPVLFEMLDQILRCGQLEQLRGMALEVDTKTSDLIADELTGFLGRYTHVFDQHVPRGLVVGVPFLSPGPAQCSIEADVVLNAKSLTEAYDLYAQVVSSRAEPVGPNWMSPTACADELNWYRTKYLPYEILHWGGDIEAMFPETCRALAGQQIALDGFVSYWFHLPHPVTRSYDFFDVKIDRFVEFVSEQASDLKSLVQREATELRLAYQAANEGPLQSMGTHL